MIKLTQPVIVEGKYDKIRLSNFLDAFIVTTDGFGLFKNREKMAFLRVLSAQTPLIVLTDSDHAGQQIRARLKSTLPRAEILSVYVPRVPGKERRKTVPSKEGILGVEGLSDSIILDALARAGVFAVSDEKNAALPEIRKSDLVALGLSGCANASKNRRQLYEALQLPPDLPANSFLDYVNHCMTRKDLERMTQLCRENLKNI